MKQFTILITIVLMMLTHQLIAQSTANARVLNETYSKYKSPAFSAKRIKHAQLQPLIEDLKKHALIEVNKVGSSIEGRDLSLISLGSGPTSVFLWSQMHGDETTATQSIFDVLNYLIAPENRAITSKLLQKVSLHFLPMLNPDGAETFSRRNALGIDINRDALRLQSPEGKTLKRVRDSLNADFGFNLHDQSTYYNAERTAKPATLSFLAPAYNYEKEINEIRANSMKVICYMNNVLQKLAEGQVAKYNDDFEPRAFGDNIQKWGTSTILIESGGYANDPEKQEIRRLNYVAILAAIRAIAQDLYQEIPISEYASIPENDRKMFDLKIENLKYVLNGKQYVLDLGINRFEIDNEDNTAYTYRGSIVDQGDLSTYYGYQTFNAEEYTLKPAKINPKIISSLKSLTKTQIKAYYKQGIGYVRIDKIPMGDKTWPINLLSSTLSLPEFILKPGINPTFALIRDGEIKYMVINGFLIDINAQVSKQINGIIIGQ